MDVTVEHLWPVGPTEVYSYGTAQPHAVTQRDSDTFSYDAAGNMTSRTVAGTGETLTYDASGLVESFTSGGESTSFLSDADGTRVARVDADGTVLATPGELVEYRSSPNLLPDPGFESGTGWTEVASSSFAETTGFVRSTWGVADERTGSYGYAIHGTAYGRLRSDRFPVDAGAQYQAAAWIRGEVDPDTAGATNWLVRARWFDTTGTYLSQSTVTSGPGSSLSAAWQQVSGTVTAPQGAATGELELWFYSATGWVAYDDASFTKVGTTTNLLPDPGFETGTGWTEVVAAGYAETTGFERGTWGVADQHTGSYGYAIHTLASGYLRSDLVAVTPGEPYDASVWVRGQAGVESAGSWILRVAWYDASQGWVASTDATSGSLETLTTTWQQAAGQVTAPTDAAYASVNLWMVNGNGWVAYDDAVFSRVGDGTNLLPDPGFETGTGWTSVTAAGHAETTSFTRGSSGAANEHTGSYAQAISNLVYGRLRSDPLPVTAGTSYDVAAWLRGGIDPDSDVGWSWILRVRWYDTHGTDLGSSNATTGTTTTVTTTWGQVAGRVTAPTGAVEARAELWFYNATGWIAWDDITFTAASPTTWYHLGGRPVATRTPDGLTWVFTDHQGSLTTTTGPSGTLRRWWYPYGALRADTGPGLPERSYTAQRLDPTGLYHYQARLYDPTLRRFTTPDTIIPNPANPQTLNRYSYVVNNPTRYTDPTGHDPDESYLCPGRLYECTSDRKTFSRALWDEWERRQPGYRPDPGTRLERRGVSAREVAAMVAATVSNAVGAGDALVDDVPLYVVRDIVVEDAWLNPATGEFVWSASPAQILEERLVATWRIDVSKLGPLGAEIAPETAQRVARAATGAGVVLAFVFDAPDYRDAYQQAGWEGAVWEVGQTGAGVAGGLGGAAAFGWAAVTFTELGPIGIGVAALAGGFLGDRVGRAVYAELMPGPWESPR